MSKILLTDISNLDAPPFYIICEICKCKPILVFIDVPLHRKLYMGRCDCAIYYWCDSPLPMEYYSRYMYYSTAGADDFGKVYGEVERMFVPPRLTLSPNSLILETVGIFQNPFSSLSLGRSKINYRHYFYNELKLNPKFREAMISLEGKRLFCSSKYHYSYVIKDWFMAGCVGR